MTRKAGARGLREAKSTLCAVGATSLKQTLRNSVCRHSRVSVLVRALRVADTHECMLE